MKCPKCDGEMDQGNLLDQSYGIFYKLAWAKRVGGWMGIGTKEKITIKSYRCTKCGFLENYAK